MTKAPDNIDSIVYNVLLTNNVRFYATLAVAQEIVEQYPLRTGCEKPRIRHCLPLGNVTSAEEWFTGE